MSAPWIRIVLVVAYVGAIVATACTAEPPSSPWTPPAADARVASVPDITPTTDELPAPTPNDENDNRALFNGPWLLDDNSVDVEAPNGNSVVDDSISDDVVQTDETDWYQPTYWFGTTPWDTGIELGINGSSGNNESFSIRTGGYVKRESRFSKLDYSLYYNRTTTSEATTQNNATTDVRNDWLLDDSSPWSLYTKANLFYDEFQAFDLQTNGSTGIGYQIFKDPGLNLTTRVGGGASREFGGPDNEWTPEALFGFEYEQSVSDTQKFFATLEYYPQFADFAQYRLVADGGWEIELDRPSNLSLKISANDRFDSTPNGVDPHLVNYSVLLLLKL